MKDEKVLEIIKNLENMIEFLNQQLVFYKKMVGQKSNFTQQPVGDIGSQIKQQIDEMRKKAFANAQMTVSSVGNNIPNMKEFTMPHVPQIPQVPGVKKDE